jgi:ribosome-binding protein aMBF1 (putative translation factor)
MRFAYETDLRLIDDEQATVPHEVVELVVKKGYNLARAWREHLGLTQREVAKRAGITQSAVSQMERAENSLNNATLEKLARAMGIRVEQLTD